MKKFIKFGWFSQPVEIGLANPKESDLAIDLHHCVSGEGNPLTPRKVIAKEVAYVVSNPESNDYLFINSSYSYAFRARDFG